MSTCLFLIRGVQKIDCLRKDLVSFAMSVNFGINFYPIDILLTHHQISLQTWDFVFSLCDSFELLGSCDCVLYPEGAPINAREHPLPFKERMLAIQQIAEIALQHCGEVELFLSDDNPYLPDFVVCNASCQHVAETLEAHYTQSELPYDIPFIHMKIT